MTPIRILLLARTGSTAAPVRDMERWAASLSGKPGVASAGFAFIEEGTPSLRAALLALVDGGLDPVVIVPFVLPAEPTLEAWLKRTLKRLQEADGRAWPEFRLAGFPGLHPAMEAVVGDLALSSAAKTLDLANAVVPEGSVVADAHRRVLVCTGGPCNAVGAATIWGHLRNEQKRLGLRTAGEGMMSAKTSCLGPCSLAPVVQVWPEGTLYGGVDEMGIDRIVSEHLLTGKIVEDLAYAPGGAKQALRR